ncbi:MAG: nitrate reductase [Candidatus Pelagadaptatus aseana]|uniref:molybdopterin-dependent oxidoreductase n=1 Tax=Candidatus Pelagadaptatus aseana TaxID=3120508 RepID=UPI0039B2C0B3
MPTESSSAWTKTTCAYCGVGCGVEAKPNSKGQLDIRGDKDHPANYGRLCSKGLALGETVTHEGRLLYPRIGGVRTDWNSALDHVAKSFADTIAEHGPDSVAFYVSGQILTEDYYVANKLMKGFIGSGNIDTNSRLCMSSTVAGHQRAFGTDTVPGCYTDLEQADMVVITGSNMAWCHPVLYQRLKAAKLQRPNLFVVSIDPRVTDTCEIADLHLPINPGSDVVLFNGLLNYLASNGNLNQAFIDNHTEHFDQTLAQARQDLENVGDLHKVLGIQESDLHRFYQRFAQTEKVVTLFSQGVNQSTCGSDKVNSILNCHLATGRIGNPGSGPFSLTGQPNAMGGREVGGLASTLAVHIPFGNDRGHQLVSEFWETDQLAAKPGLKAVDLFDAIDEGKVKAIWIMATNPVVSLPDADKIKRALKKCPMVVVSDCIADTDTTRCADVLLPAQGWSEKSGTVTNSERRISRQRRLLPSPGEARPDWWIISEVGKRMGFAKAFDYLHEGEVFREYALMTQLGNLDGSSRDLDLSGLTTISDSEYANLQPQQWPLRQPDEKIEHKRLFSDGRFFTPSGKAQFIGVSYQAPATQTSTDLPLSLNSGRIRDQWHTMTRTGLSARLGAHLPEPYVSVHPDDAEKYQLQDGRIARMYNQWGSAQIRVNITPRMTPGQLFMPIHWTGVVSSAGRVCTLVSPDTDKVSGQPEFKFTPAAIEAWQYSSEALFISPTPIDTSNLDYWVRQKITGGYLYRIASQLTPAKLSHSLGQIVAAQNMTGQEIQFSSPEQGQYRYALMQKDHIEVSYIVASDLQNSDFDWVQSLLDGAVDTTVQSSILSGIAEGRLASGRTVCACKQVGKNTICQSIRDHDLSTVEGISEHTSAGTGCGSCVPELQSILDEELINLGTAL